MTEISWQSGKMMVLCCTCREMLYILMLRPLVAQVCLYQGCSVCLQPAVSEFWHVLLQLTEKSKN